MNAGVWSERCLRSAAGTAAQREIIATAAPSRATSRQRSGGRFPRRRGGRSRRAVCHRWHQSFLKCGMLYAAEERGEYAHFPFR